MSDERGEGAVLIEVCCDRDEVSKPTDGVELFCGGPSILRCETQIALCARELVCHQPGDGQHARSEAGAAGATDWLDPIGCGAVQ